MKLFRIYTENKDRKAIELEVGLLFPGFTILQATGHWQGTREYSLVIEILAPWTDEPLIHTVARQIRARNKQQAVLVTRQDVDAFLHTESDRQEL